MTTPTPDGLLRRPTTALTPELLESLAAKFLRRISARSIRMPTIDDECADALTEAAREIRKLRSIVDRKLLQTADSYVAAGDDLYRITSDLQGRKVVQGVDHWIGALPVFAEHHGEQMTTEYVVKCYSSRVAAEASLVAAAAAEGGVG